MKVLQKQLYAVRARLVIPLLVIPVTTTRRFLLQSKPLRQLYVNELLQQVWHDNRMYLPDVVDVVQCLQEGVHVASGPLVFEANIACSFFAVVVQVFWPVNLDHNTHLKGVIHHKPSTSLEHFSMGGKGCEAPVICLW